MGRICDYVSVLLRKRQGCLQKDPDFLHPLLGFQKLPELVPLRKPAFDNVNMFYEAGVKSYIEFPRIFLYRAHSPFPSVIHFFSSHRIFIAMDAFSSFLASQSASTNSWTYDSLKNFRQITPVVQSHLVKVYLTLCCALVASAAGACLHMLLNIGGILTTFACIGSIFWLLATPPYEEQKRTGILMGAALFEGASVGPLIELAIEVDPSVLVSAFVGTALAFGCFSGAAMLARRREYLYLGALLSSGLSMLMWLHFASSIFGGSTAFFKFELYFGLLLFVGYMVVDTQEIIERAHLGDLDSVKHALTLFTDFVGVFVRILIIMLKNSSERKEKKKRRN